VIPHLAQGIADLAAKLTRDIAPETASRYAMANTGLIGMLLAALAQDAERAVAVRLEDIDDMRSLLARMPAQADPDDQPAREEFRGRAPHSLRLTDVDALHAEGLNLLIAAHAWAEREDPDLDRDIWAFLARHTERHRFDLAV
jgi:hypothetical protein